MNPPSGLGLMEPRSDVLTKEQAQAESGAPLDRHTRRKPRVGGITPQNLVYVFDLDALNQELLPEHRLGAHDQAHPVSSRQPFIRRGIP